jgi:hypothetical protein
MEILLQNNEKLICNICHRFYRVGNIGSLYWYNRFLKGVFMRLNPYGSALSLSSSTYDAKDWDTGTPEKEKYNRDNSIPIHAYQSILNILFVSNTRTIEYMWKFSNKHIWLYDFDETSCKWCVLLRLIDCHYRVFCVNMLEIHNKKQEKPMFQKAMSAVMVFAQTRHCFIMYIKNKQENNYASHIQWMEEVGMTQHIHPSNAPFTVYNGISSTNTIIMKSHSLYPSYESALWKRHTRIHSVFTEEEIFNQFRSCKAH